MRASFSRALRDDADAQLPVGALPGVLARLAGFNGTAYSRLGCFAPSSLGDVGGEGSAFLGVIDYRFGYNGATWSRMRVPNVFKIIAAVAIVAAAGAVVWTPAAGKKFRLMGYYLSSSAAAALIFCDHVVGTPILRSPLLAAAGIAQSTDMGNGILSATANNVLRLDVSVNATVTGSVWGTEE